MVKSISVFILKTSNDLSPARLTKLTYFFNNLLICII